MADFDPADPLHFFVELTHEFGAILARTPGGPEIAAQILHEVLAQFETHLARQNREAEMLACRGGCAACCALRVTATAPEIIAIARHLRGISTVMPAFGRILTERIEAAAEHVAGLAEVDYLALGRPCPFVLDGHCVIYELRPLACRGHASFDAEACQAALSGKDVSVPIAETDRLLRSYVQGALQSALRDTGFAWAIYEFLPALAVALRERADEAWTRGEDPFAAQRAADVGLAEMAETFDQIKRLAP